VKRCALITLVVLGCAVTAGSALASTTIHGCVRAVSLPGPVGLAGIYDFGGGLSCKAARHVVRYVSEHGRPPPGFKCHRVQPRISEPEGAERCTDRRKFVEFADE
jgi:hypothetical protein